MLVCDPNQTQTHMLCLLTYADEVKQFNALPRKKRCQIFRCAMDHLPRGIPIARNVLEIAVDFSEYAEYRLDPDQVKILTFGSQDECSITMEDICCDLATYHDDLELFDLRIVPQVAKSVDEQLRNIMDRSRILADAAATSCVVVFASSQRWRWDRRHGQERQ